MCAARLERIDIAGSDGLWFRDPRGSSRRSRPRPRQARHRGARPGHVTQPGPSSTDTDRPERLAGLGSLWASAGPAPGRANPGPVADRGAHAGRFGAPTLDLGPLGSHVCNLRSAGLKEWGGLFSEGGRPIDLEPSSGRRQRQPPGDGRGASIPAQLRLVPLAPLTERVVAIDHTYFEIVYTPRLGPTAVLLARSMVRHLGAHPAPTTVSTAELACEVGLRADPDHPIGKQSSLPRALNRLTHARIVQWCGRADLGIRVAVPLLTPVAVASLPRVARQTHRMFEATLDMSNRLRGAAEHPAD